MLTGKLIHQLFICAISSVRVRGVLVHQLFIATMKLQRFVIAFARLAQQYPYVVKEVLTDEEIKKLCGRK